MQKFHFLKSLPVLMTGNAVGKDDTLLRGSLSAKCNELFSYKGTEIGIDCHYFGVDSETMRNAYNSLLGFQTFFNDEKRMKNFLHAEKKSTSWLMKANEFVAYCFVFAAL